MTQIPKEEDIPSPVQFRLLCIINAEQPLDGRAVARRYNEEDHIPFGTLYTTL